MHRPLSMFRLAALLSVISLTATFQLLASSPYGKQYDKLLKAQGYTPLKHPRSNFGVGTIIPIDAKKNLYIAAQSECFPDLDKNFQKGDTKLIDSQDYKNLKIDASGSYSPTGGASFFSKLAAAFGFDSSATLNVTYGTTSAVDLTPVALEQYLTDKHVTKACADRLRDPKNAVIFSMASVDSMTYTFSGKKKVTASASADAVKGAVSAAGDVEYDHNVDNGVKITSPLYVGYNAYVLKDLQITLPESSAGVPTIMSFKAVKTAAKLPGD
jgi:hypothetical protein